MATIRMTMAQALVRFLDNQYISRDGVRTKYIHGIFAVFGHGNVVGLGEALVEMEHSLVLYQGHNEQGMAHAATAFAKQKNRLQICAATSSIGPGAMNMVTAAATATVNRIPVLLLPGDSFACRQPDPVLQQIEQSADLNVTANDAFKPVSAYWDRISRPDQLMTAALNALRTLTDPAITGAVTLCLPQDTQAEAYDYPEEFFKPRTWIIERTPPAAGAVKRASIAVSASKRPLLIAGGGVRYSDAGTALSDFCEKTGIPFAETQAGKGVLRWDHPLNMGGLGVTGGLAANKIAAKADLIIAVGTRLGDFTTASKSAFQNPDVKILTINVNSFDALKMDSSVMVCDARLGLESLAAAVEPGSNREEYASEIHSVSADWRAEVERLYADPGTDGVLSQTGVLGILNEEMLPDDAIVVGSSGSLPGDMQRLWRTRTLDAYHMEYGFSCMGYEISGAFGVKLASPDREVVAMTGDGSYIMLHSEMVTAVREGVKIIVVVFDNSGYQCIDNLQTSQGISSYATFFRTRSKDGRLDGPTAPFDFAANAAAYGAWSRTARTADELRAALREALEIDRTCVIDVKVSAKSMTGGYESWWRVGVPEVSENPAVTEAYNESVKMVDTLRPY
ncbi:MAG: 3D-(3,5/4)-trihydroxycyclohexane-1,2-dione acylhydrolase (decyclizing) [Spirochaetales bacterium]|jgi:3D-(3,5/4)-trihydroxycyclohexane-1,2-dione acylhydrolase (decyclizing)|nr:3D-(3,5/4)-trihydroxycyclohexane-1,2-dione acylhydrolase (decyclizing) [Spirochaetales bacterium]